MIKRVSMLLCDCDKCGYRWQATVVPVQCSKCKSRDWNDGNRGGGWAYFARSADGLIKIGWTTKPYQRVMKLRTDNDGKLDVLFMLPGDNQSLESAFHRHFHSKRHKGEWFSLTDSDLEIAKSLEVIPTGMLCQTPVKTTKLTCKCHRPKWLSRRMLAR